MTGLDKHALARNFNGAASAYDQYAVVQDMVRDRLLEQLPVFRIKPRRILDLGSGTGKGAAALGKHFSQARLLQMDISQRMLMVARQRHSRLFKRDGFVCADADRLPLADASFEMVFSCLMLQWSPDLEQLFSGVRRILSPGGLFLFATFGPETLTELRQSWGMADDREHVHNFHDIRLLGDLLVKCGFSQPVLDSESVVVTYENVKSIMRDLKSIGAANVNSARRKSLTGKQRYQRCANAYEQFRQDGKLPATYEIIYGHAWVEDLARSDVQQPMRFVEPDRLK